MQLDFSMPVMVVDDSATMGRIISSLLSSIGYENIATVGEGKLALEKLKDGKFGLVVSDWNMKPMTGYELLCHMRNDDKLRHTPFIMVTAEAKAENVIAAKKAGVNNYIVKPFNASALRSKIYSVFDDS